MRARELYGLRDRLTQEGLRAEVYDNLFVGEGPRPTGETAPSMDDQARHQWECLDRARLDEDTAPVTLFGLSMGGMIVATMAAQRSADVAQLILGATSPNLPDCPAIPEPVWRAWLGIGNLAELDYAVSMAFGTTSLSTHPEIKNSYLDYRARRANGQSPKDFSIQLRMIRDFPGEIVYAQVRASGVPTTIITGDEDRLFPAEHLRALQAVLPAAECVRLTRTGHFMHLERPERVAALIAARAHLKFSARRST
jgi:pimeloyl-ACP methyl ester carboxylesterase